MGSDPVGSDDEPSSPSLPWRFGSAAVMGIVGTLTRTFMNVLNTQTADGLDEFVELLDRRADIEKRERGLITVSNHICVMDDPLAFGVLPFKYAFNPANHRWSLASYDICFKYNKAVDLFWTLGQTLPTHRLRYSPYGGLFQPTMREAVRLLSHAPFRSPNLSVPRNVDRHVPNITDPFSTPNHTYTFSTNGVDSFPAPSAYATRQYSWIHIFPEGKIHQHPMNTMRYFKWGIARLILEPDVCPDIVPIWLEGNDQVMHEERQWPRFLPRIGKKCGVWFGQNVGGGNHNRFSELRSKWRQLAEEKRQKGDVIEMGDLNDDLKYGKEAVALREECARRVRQAVLEVRQKTGRPDEDPKASLVETWREEGGDGEGKKKDNSIVRDL